MVSARRDDGKLRILVVAHSTCRRTTAAVAGARVRVAGPSAAAASRERKSLSWGLACDGPAAERGGGKGGTQSNPHPNGKGPQREGAPPNPNPPNQ